MSSNLKHVADLRRTQKAVTASQQQGGDMLLDNRQPRQEILAGLMRAEAAIAPKFFYDALGSHLFEAITCLPEYYLTRAEQALMSSQLPAIADAIGRRGTLIDLGAGNCAKARLLLDDLQPRQYVAVDISATFVTAALERMQADFPDIAMQAVGADLTTPFALPDSVGRERRLFFYPGSSIGNFDPPEALALLVHLRELCGDGSSSGGLLIGVDLVKDRQRLEAAYDDALGITAAFNLNVLNHLNALIGSDFNTRNWRHRAHYDSHLQRIEMHLEATRNQEVSWPGGSRVFALGECIHTENSYKYTAEQFGAMLTDAGFTGTHCWRDAQQCFAVFYAR